MFTSWSSSTSSSSSSSGAGDSSSSSTTSATASLASTGNAIEHFIISMSPKADEEERKRNTAEFQRLLVDEFDNEISTQAYNFVSSLNTFKSFDITQARNVYEVAKVKREVANYTDEQILNTLEVQIDFFRQQNIPKFNIWRAISGFQQQIERNGITSIANVKFIEGYKRIVQKIDEIDNKKIGPNWSKGQVDKLTETELLLLVTFGYFERDGSGGPISKQKKQFGFGYMARGTVNTAGMEWVRPHRTDMTPLKPQKPPKFMNLVQSGFRKQGNKRQYRFPALKHNAPAAEKHIEVANFQEREIDHCLLCNTAQMDATCIHWDTNAHVSIIP